VENVWYLGGILGRREGSAYRGGVAVENRTSLERARIYTNELA
jgi:hypothetical protein